MGRIIAVGDSFQSIYAFRAADITAIPNIQKMLEARGNGCKVFPLSVCRRCPQSHIRLAQAIVPDIQWCVKERDGIDAPLGEIHQVSKQAAITMMQPSDLGVSRVNRVLVPIAYALIKAKKKVIIRGGDIGTGLIELIKRLKPVDVPDLVFKVGRYERKELNKFMRADTGIESDGMKVEDAVNMLSHKNQQRIQSVMEKTGCIIALCDGVDSVAQIIANIKSIFAEFDDSGKPKDAIVLGTVHRTKGLEAHNVFMIDPTNFPHPLASRDWEREQERNLAYVAVTRAKFQLDDKGNVVEPGRLIFIGQCPDIFKADWLTPSEPTDIEVLRGKLIAHYVKMQTPQSVAETMVERMDDNAVRQCASSMSL